MSEPYLGQISVFSFNFAPKGWALCNGQLLPINQNQALFALMGTMYGGNGQVNFGLPDLRGRAPLHVDGGIVQGQPLGSAAVTLSQAEMPPHTHPVSASNTAADRTTPVGNIWARPAANAYGEPVSGTAMRGDLVTEAGGSQPHNNMQPYTVLSFCVALQGLFPSRN
ncbi:phage tail protein [Isoalcanivorax indicus]|uniref:phage tail protein n=1 Tax=Isoalcanivorax indicus TaxID=2202653 RepID=UPI000DB8FD67|nr:tail fiber protein [Isoalcanivorax indicus]